MYSTHHSKQNTFYILYFILVYFFLEFHIDMQCLEIANTSLCLLEFPFLSLEISTFYLVFPGLYP